jgi:hypothetical protein
MRGAIAVVSLLAGLTFAVPAEADRRMFIVANNPDGYGVDRCLASGEKCGTAAATAYCRSRDFAAAQSFRKVDKDDITGAIPNESATGGACKGGLCQEFVAIECTR